MTNKQLMNAGMLEIVFENRNKEYGAYALRIGYSNRLLVATIAGLIVVFLFALVSSANQTEKDIIAVTENPGIVIRALNLPEKKIEKLKMQKEILKPRANEVLPPELATVRFTSPPEIVEVVRTPIPAIEDLEGKLTADMNREGELVEKNIVMPVLFEIKKGLGYKEGADKLESEFIIQEQDPEFPGGTEALKRFLGRYLTTPGNLAAGEKKVVKIKFKVDKDGSVNTLEIVTSGGFEFDNEVVRVCKKMPRWIPALQNGINVPVNYVLPITFIGVDE